MTEWLFLFNLNFFFPAKSFMMKVTKHKTEKEDFV